MQQHFFCRHQHTSHAHLARLFVRFPLRFLNPLNYRIGLLSHKNESSIQILKAPFQGYAATENNFGGIQAAPRKKNVSSGAGVGSVKLTVAGPQPSLWTTS